MAEQKNNRKRTGSQSQARPDNRVDFDKIRKRRQRVQTIKRWILLSAVVLAAGGIIVLNRLAIDAGATILLSDFVEGRGGSGYPVAVPGGIIRDVKSMGSDLVILNDTNLYIYNKNGKVLNSLQQMTEQTVLAASSSRVLTCDTGSRSYGIYSRSQTLLQRESTYALLGADLNERGDYALISSSGQSATQVTVYNKKFLQMFQLDSTNMISEVSVSPKGNRMVVGNVDTRGGEANSYVYIYEFSVTSGPVTELVYPGERLINLQYLDDGRISVVTNACYRLLTSDGREESVYRFGGRTIQALERRGKQVLLLLQPMGGREVELILLGTDLKEQASTFPEGRIRDMALSDNRIYVLGDGGITTYTHDMQVRDVYEQRGISDIHAIKNRVYYLDREEIRVLEHT